MKKLLLAGLFAVAGVGFVDAQNTYQPPTNCNPCYPPVRRCCDNESDIYLNMRISKILCLYPDKEYSCWVAFDCKEDFNVSKPWYDLSDGDQNFVFGVWSNVLFDVGVRAATADFVRITPALPGFYNPFPASNVEWRVGATASATAPALANPAHYNTTWKTLSNAVAGSKDNAINKGPNGIHAFALNFRTKAPLANPTQYMPGLYTLDVKVTATED
jgi:hypothetical protein